MNPRVLDLFDCLCDAETSQIESMLADEAPEIRSAVRAMLEADRGATELPEPEQVLDAIASDFATDLSPAPDVELSAPPGYVLVSRIGRGTMGEVWEARQIAPDRKVAIKFLIDPRGSRLSKEGQALADIRHPAIPVVYEVGEHNGLAYIVMERVEGIPLNRWSEHATPQQKLRLFRLLCDAVRAAHDRGIVHRDIKPANILVENDSPWLLDFGFAVPMGGDAAVAGTPAYLAPEILAGAPPSMNTDLFSLGVVLAEMIGRRPTPDEHSLSGQRHGRRRHPPEDWSANNTPPDLMAIIRKALGPPNTRYRSCAELAADLDRYQVMLPVQARPLDWVQRTGLAIRRNGVLLRRSALLAAVLLLAGGGWLLLNRVSEAARERSAEHIVNRALVEIGNPTERAESFEAVQMLNALLALPGLTGTRAAARAQIRKFELLQAHDPDEALGALALAFVESDAPDTRAAVALRLASLFEERRDWEALSVLLPHLPDNPTRRRLSRLAALGMRDFGSPVLEGEPHLLALGRGIRLPYRPQVARSLGPDHLVFIEQEARRITLLDRSLQVVEQIPIDLPMRFSFGTPFPTEKTKQLLGASEDGTQMILWDYSSGHLQEVTRKPTSGPPVQPLWTDLDEDGSPTLYVGTQAYDRSLYSWNGSWANPSVEIEQYRSDAMGLAVGDFDDDGHPELASSWGPWSAYDVRILSPDPDDTHLQTRARWRTHGSSVIRSLRTPRGTRLAVATSLGSRVPTAEDASSESGVRVLALQDDELVSEQFTPLPVHSDLRSILSADLDGDGADELLVAIGDSADHTAVIDLKTTAPWYLHPVVPLWAGQLDDDPEDELIVRFTDDDMHAWVLGMGQTPVPTSRRRQRPLDSPDVASDSLHWAEFLAQLGLFPTAAELLERTAPAEPDDRIASAQLRYAGDLYSFTDRLGDAKRVLTTALERSPPDRRNEVRELLTQVLIRCHHYEAIETVDTHPEIAALAEAPQLDLDFSEPLHPNLDIRAPEALHRTSEGLALQAVMADGVLARMPLRKVAERVGIEIEIEVAMAETGADFEVALVDDTGTVWLSVGVFPWGGHHQIDRMVRCRGRSASDHLRQYDRLRSTIHWTSEYKLRVDFAQGETLCGLSMDGNREGVLRHPSTESPPDELWLELRIDHPSDAYLGAAIDLVVHRVGLIGLEPRPSGPVDPIRRQWAEGAGDQALTSLTPGTRDHALLSLALGDLAGARPGLHLFDDRTWIGVLRRYPSIGFSLLGEARPEDRGRLAAAAWTEAYNGTTEILDSTLNIPGIDEIALEREVQQLLLNRARVLAQGGHGDRATRLMDRLVQRFPTFEVYMEHAQVLAGIGRDTEAAASCAMASQLASNPMLYEDVVLGDPALRVLCQASTAPLDAPSQPD